jgi:hypothetical protein
LSIDNAYLLHLYSGDDNVHTVHVCPSPINITNPSHRKNVQLGVD